MTLASRQSPPRLRLVLALDQALGCLGLFSLLPVLGLLLAESGSAAVGAGLFCYTASAGLSALLINRLLPRIRYATGMAGSMLLSGAAFGLIPYTGSGWARCALLGLAGLGISVHFVMQRVLVAEIVRDDIGRHRVYSMLQIAVNAPAALGPFIGSFLYVVDARLLIALVSASYLLAGIVVYAGGPRELRTLRPPPTTSRWPVSRPVLLAALRTPATRRVLLVSTLGAFVYGQFFSAFALSVAHDFDQAALRAALIAAPAVLIVLAQAAVTRAVTRFLHGEGAGPFTVLLMACVAFGTAMLPLGLGLGLTGAVVAVLVFSLAEMMFTPMVSTAFAALPIASSLESFNLRQVCWTAGEAFGSLAGGSVFLWLHLSGDGALYWLLLGAVTLACTAALHLRR